ncbi:sulfite exporter TauE/SafE family protein [Paenibacillus humicola]|uniref:sulfite exporter TauE/SafE family protein n=1 Tax=Paenibacillus humicola TaxID=3110540 RepID=UPI00237BB644|nr:sulfite exporter TauE/SafE family protein [Paenibacillus humicola]
MSWQIVTMGLLVGFLVGLTGVGGASLLTPILLLIGINPSIAVGTDLLYNSITKFFGTIQHWRQKTIDFKIVKYLAFGSLPGAVFGVGASYLLSHVFDDGETVLKHVLGFILIIVSVITLLRQLLDKKLGDNRWQLKPIEDKRMLLILIGAVLGFIVGLTSVGSGSLFAVAMIYLFRLSGSQLVGTDIAHAFLLVTLSAILHSGLGNIDYGLTANLLIGSVPGVIIGSSLSAKVPSKPLRTVLAALLLISGVKLI